MAAKNIIELEITARKAVSYSHYRAGVPLIQRLYVKNTGGEPIENVTVSVDSQPGVLLPFKTEIETLPFESTVEIDLAGLSYSPYYLSNAAQEERAAVSVRVEAGKTLCLRQAVVTVLPYEYWLPENEFVELVAGFVKPRGTEIAKLLREAANVLTRWKLPNEISGYEGCGKNTVRQIAAAICTAVQLRDFTEMKVAFSQDAPNYIRSPRVLMEERNATTLEMSLLVASCLEAAGFHPVLAVSGETVNCGVWLYDNCFVDSYNQDAGQLKKYLGEGVNALTCFDVSCLFGGSAQNFTGAEKRFRGLLEDGDFRYLVDVSRCRAGGVRPLPEKVATANGAELLSEGETALSLPPRPLSGGEIIRLSTPPSREKQWERRLLDLSLKNMLLSYRPSANTLHLISTDAAGLSAAFAENSQFTLMEAPPDAAGILAKAKNFDTKLHVRQLGELTAIELKNKRLRAFSDAKRTGAALAGLYKRERTAIEEMGTDPLYVAVGFLKWYDRENSQFPKYAPLVLYPAALIKKGGGKGYFLRLREDGVQLNTTLLEFLKQEFAIDLRGLDAVPREEFKILDVIASVRNGVINMPGWDVVEDAHLAIFSFTRYLMWNDVRNHIGEFAGNRLIKSLMDNRLCFSPEETRLEEADVDSFPPSDVLLPIACDASQFSAVAEANAGKSFVLHGPPGTGKSQTITNMIANALASGKRVLFVAEKMAALSVVKKRLDAIGIGDFCLELHSNKSDKLDVTNRLLSTLSLKKSGKSQEFTRKAAQVAELRGQLNAPLNALHRKHYLGISVYEAVLGYLKNQSAPDVMEVESTFLDDLTDVGLERCEAMLTELSGAARECGEVYRSPFNDLDLFEYTPRLSSALVTVSRVLIEEIKHLRAYVALALDVFGHRVRTMTQRKIEALYELASLLTEKDSVYGRIFGGREGSAAAAKLAEFSALYFAQEGKLAEYRVRFKLLAEPPAPPQTLRAELADWGNDRKKCRNLKALAKKLERYASGRIAEAELPRYLELAISLYEGEKLLESKGEELAECLNTGGKLDYRQAAEMTARLNALYGRAEELFSDYDSATFNAMCARLYGEDRLPILRRMQEAYEAFATAREEFISTLHVTGDYSQLDDDYLDYLSMKALALIENSDLAPSWCAFRQNAEKLREAGLSFAVEPLLSGALTSDNLLACFRKKVYRYYIETQIAEDPVLASFSGGQTEERIARFKQAADEFEALTREEIRARLLARIPDVDTEGSLSLEIVQLQKIAKSSAHSFTLRKVFEDIPNLLPRIAPCMLMSPISVAQYLAPQANQFDLVVFDEASQMPTAEAVGAIARAKSVVVVGDPKQLPPTSFFSSDYVDEENLENEDLESILDDCLALGMPQKHLLWHYRSKHESLIAFSNIMYYGNRLNTFPSPDSLESKVSLRYLPDAVYDRGGSKQNRKEAEALVEEVKRRLTDKALAKSSIGIVTFSTAQQELVESLLSAMLIKCKLESAAYEREEPVFVKNLENVQGDERDVILFSVGYGPDKFGGLLLNFGPLNQAAGWRRLNVAVSRAREEMIVFSSMTSAMIDLSRTNSKGVAGLKRFLEFADKGRGMLAINSSEIFAKKTGIGKFIARELRTLGYDCHYDVGVSGFKIDVAVMDPRNRKRFLLAILADGDAGNSCKDRNVLQVQTLKRLNWNVARIWTLNFMNNPKREVKRIRDIIDRILGTGKKPKAADRFLSAYKTANIKAESVTSGYLHDEENQEEILARLQAIVEGEEPISREFLIKRCLTSYGILKTGANISARMNLLADKLQTAAETLDGTVFYRVTDEPLRCETYRIEEGDMVRRGARDISPYELVAAMRSVLEEKVALYPADLVKEAAAKLGFSRGSAQLFDRIRYALEYGVSRSLLIKSVGEKITNA